MNLRTWLVFAALGVIWGVPYFFIKLAVQELSPFVIAWSRIALATVVLLPIAWQRGALRPVTQHMLAIGAFAIVEFVIPFSAISLGEQWISSSVTGMLIATVPLTIALISRFFGLHEPLGTWRLVGLVVGFAGVAALLGFGTLAGPLAWAGVGCMLLATLGYAIGPLIVQRYLGAVDPLGPIAGSLGVAAVLLMPLALLHLPARLPTSRALASVAVLGLVCTALAMVLMFYLIRHAGAARASVITYINPIVATLLGVAILHEPLGLGGIAAFALILAGSWLATRGAPVRRPAAPARALA
jgi:drug/metabolite transporter (DMT)-like permease